MTPYRELAEMPPEPKPAREPVDWEYVATVTVRFLIGFAVVALAACLVWLALRPEGPCRDTIRDIPNGNVHLDTICDYRGQKPRLEGTAILCECPKTP